MARHRASRTDVCIYLSIYSVKYVYLGILTKLKTYTAKVLITFSFFRDFVFLTSDAATMPHFTTFVHHVTAAAA